MALKAESLFIAQDMERIIKDYNDKAQLIRDTAQAEAVLRVAQAQATKLQKRLSNAMSVTRIVGDVPLQVIVRDEPTGKHRHVHINALGTGFYANAYVPPIEEDGFEGIFNHSYVPVGETEVVNDEPERHNFLSEEMYITYFGQWVAKKVAAIDLEGAV